MAVHFEFEIRIRFHHIDDHIEGAHAFGADDGLIDVEVDAVGNDLGVGEFLADHIHSTPFCNPEILKYYRRLHTANAPYFNETHLTAAAVGHDHDTILILVAFDLNAFFN